MLYFTLYLRAVSKYKSPGGLYSEGRFNGGFFALRIWGAYIWRGLYMEGLTFGILRYLLSGYHRISDKKPLGEKVSNTSPADEKSTVSPAHDTPIYTTTTLLQAHYWPHIKTPSHPLFRLSKKSPVRSNMARDLKVT